MEARSRPRQKGFRLIATTADMGIIAYGSSLKELFSHAAQGLTALMIDPGEIRPQSETAVAVQGANREELLLHWLNELLYIREVKEFLGREFVIAELSDTHLRALVRGEKRDPGRHHFRREVKAVTYHRLQIRAKDTGWEAEVIVDL